MFWAVFVPADLPIECVVGTNGSCQPLALRRSASISLAAIRPADTKNAWEVKNLLPAPTTLALISLVSVSEDLQ